MSNGSVNISARFPAELVERAQEEAEREDRSLSQLLRLALRERLEREQSAGQVTA